MMKFLPAIILLLAAGPVFAQGSTQSPPSATSASGGVQSSNSLPVGAANMNSNAGGSGTVTGNPATGGPGAAMSQTVPTPAVK